MEGAVYKAGDDDDDENLVFVSYQHHLSVASVLHGVSFFSLVGVGGL